MISSQNKYRPNGRFNSRTKSFLFRKKINNSNNEQEYSYSEQKDSSKVNHDRQSSKWADPAIIVATIGIIVSIGMMVYTALLFNETVRQRKLTEQSTQAALAASKEAKRANDIAADNMQSQRFADSLANIKDSIRLGISQQSLQAQINSIQESQRQFEIANMPFLEITDIAINNFKIGKTPSIDYKISNKGRMPAKIIETRFVIGYIPKGRIDTKTFFDSLSKTKVGVGGYIGYQEQKMFEYNAHHYIDKQFYDLFANQQYYVYFGGEFKYINESNGRKRIMKFLIQLSIDNNDWLLNYFDNKDI